MPDTQSFSASKTWFLSGFSRKVQIDYTEILMNQKQGSEPYRGQKKKRAMESICRKAIFQICVLNDCLLVIGTFQTLLEVQQDTGQVVSYWYIIHFYHFWGSKSNENNCFRNKFQKSWQFWKSYLTLFHFLLLKPVIRLPLHIGFFVLFQTSSSRPTAHVFSYFYRENRCMFYETTILMMEKMRLEGRGWSTEVTCKDY